MKNSLEPRVELLQIDPRTRYFRALGAAIIALLPIIPLGLAAAKFDWPKWLLLIYGIFALGFAVRYASAAHARFGYALLDDGLWLESGVFWRKAVFVPRVRVQHTEVNHGPLDRKMGLAKLVLHTAGVRLQHLTIPGLSDTQAHALRDNLLKRDAAPPPRSIDHAPEIDHSGAADAAQTQIEPVILEPVIQIASKSAPENRPENKPENEAVRSHAAETFLAVKLQPKSDL